MTISFAKPVFIGAALTLVAMTLAGCVANETTAQISTISNKVVQLEKSNAQVEALSIRITQLERNLAEAKKAQPEPFVVGLGEIMGLNQMRHAKLWFAGENENWALASYELVELREGFDDAIKFHPTHDGVPRPLTEMIPEFIEPRLAEVEKSVAAKDKVQFETAFDGLTTGCNSCHQAANFGFNRITRPTAPPYSNQDFAPAR